MSVLVSFLVAGAAFSLLVVLAIYDRKHDKWKDWK